MKTRIPEETLKEWKPLKEHGDISKIITANKKQNFTRDEVSAALRYGYASQELIKVIAEYYGEKSLY